MICALKNDDTNNIRLSEQCYDDYDTLDEVGKTNCRKELEFSQQKIMKFYQIHKKFLIIENDINNHEKRTITYKFEVFQL